MFDNNESWGNVALPAVLGLASGVGAAKGLSSLVARQGQKAVGKVDNSIQHLAPQAEAAKQNYNNVYSQWLKKDFAPEMQGAVTEAGDASQKLFNEQKTLTAQRDLLTKRYDQAGKAAYGVGGALGLGVGGLAGNAMMEQTASEFKTLRDAFEKYASISK